jgi:hypothetical protein
MHLRFLRSYNWISCKCCAWTSDSLWAKRTKVTREAGRRMHSGTAKNTATELHWRAPKQNDTQQTGRRLARWVNLLAPPPPPKSEQYIWHLNRRNSVARWNVSELRLNVITSRSWRIIQSLHYGSTKDWQDMKVPYVRMYICIYACNVPALVTH